MINDGTTGRASDAVYETLRKSILDSALAPGQRIESNLISRQMGVSRMPVKQALDRLAAEGLLVVRPSKGTFVAQPSLHTTNEAFEVRIALELLAAARTMEKLDQERFAALEDAVERLERLPYDADVVAHMQENERFHTLLVKFSDNETLLDMYRRLRAHIQIAQIHYRSSEWQRRRETERSEHRAILEALRAKDAGLLSVVLKRHLERACESLLEDIGRKHESRYPFAAAPRTDPPHRASRADEACYTTSDRWEVAWWQTGDGPDILLLHGYACTSEDWAAVARALSRRWRVTRLDFPGHGSTRGPEPASITELVHALADVSDAACASAPLIVGHSMGGMVALSHVLDTPSAAAGLVLAEAFPCLAAVTDTFGPPHDEADPFGDGSVLDQYTPVHVESFVRAEMAAGVPRAGSLLFDALERFDVRDRLGELDVPVRLLLGDRRSVSEETLPATLARLGFDGVPQMEAVLLDSHHFVMLEQPEAVARAIDDFAAKCLANGTTEDNR